MKALNHKSLALLVLATGFSSAAMAGGNATVNVSATVTGTCLFNSNGAVSFPLNPNSGGDAAGTVQQPQFWCTSGTAYTISDDFGANEAVPGSAPRRLSNGTDFIPYSLSYTTSGNGAGKNNPITMDIAANVANDDFVNAPAGSYTDTVTLTITP